MAKAYDFGTHSKTSDSALYKLPPPESDYNLYKKAFRNICDPESPGHIEHLRECELGRAMYLSKQWLTLNVTERDRNRAIRFTEQDPTKKIPRPVNNEILPIVDNEAAKLYRRKSTAYVRPVALQEGSSGKYTGAAKATDILEWHLEMMGWSRARRTAVFRSVLYGTAFFWSYLDQSYMDSVRVGMTGARRCYSGCDMVLASEELPSQAYEQAFSYDPKRVHRAATIDADSGDVSYAYRATACLKCGGPLTEATITDEALLSEGDFFGQSLYDDHPKNQPMLDMPEPWEIFVENEGIGIEGNDPTKVKKWYRVTPRSLDYLEEHYPWCTGRFDRDSPREIADYYPVVGEYGFGSAGGMNVEQRNVWRDHALEFTAVESPTQRYPEGRYVVVAGGEVCREEPLFRKSKRNPENKVPLVSVTAARFFVKDGEIKGQGLVRGLLSPQNRLNMCYAMVTDSRQRNGVDAVVATDGMRLTSGWVDGYTGRVLRYTPDPARPQLVPQHVPSRMIDSSIYAEIDHILDHMRSFAGSTDADRGEAPRNVSAATAIQMLQEAVQGRREGREQELIDAFREVFSHQLLLLAEFAVEPRSFRRKTQSGQWEYLEFTGLDLEGHTDVIIEEQAGYDAKAFEREALLQGIQAQIIVAQSPYARREAAKVLGISMKILDEENVQISTCEARFYAFRNHQIIPPVDPDLDDHTLMFSVYGRFLMTSEGIEMSEAAGWPQILPLIAGWDKKLAQARQLDRMVRELQATAQGQPGSVPPPPPPVPGMPPVPPPPDPVIMAQETLAQMEAQGRPPELALLPDSVVDQILIVWANLGVDVENPYTKMMAVVRAHMLLGESKKAQAMAGPRLAAPGGQRTPIGTEPVLGSTPIPDAGVGGSPGVPQ